MWVMIIKKLPTQPSPPKMSIFWAVPWPDDKYAPEQKKELENQKDWEWDEEGIDGRKAFGKDPETASFYTMFGKEPNWIGAVKIYYKRENIRVFPHEMSKLPLSRMKEYIDSGEYEFVEEDTAQLSIPKMKLNPDTRGIFESALLDGCNTEQANMVLAGVNITEDEIDFPPQGWYRLSKNYAQIFCTEREMSE